MELFLRASMQRLYQGKSVLQLPSLHIMRPVPTKGCLQALGIGYKRRVKEEIFGSYLDEYRRL